MSLIVYSDLFKFWNCIFMLKVEYVMSLVQQSFQIYWTPQTIKWYAIFAHDILLIVYGRYHLILLSHI